jgi:hypothetical protein
MKGSMVNYFRRDNTEYGTTNHTVATYSSMMQTSGDRPQKPQPGYTVKTSLSEFQQHLSSSWHAILSVRQHSQYLKLVSNGVLIEEYGLLDCNPVQ